MGGDDREERGARDPYRAPVFATESEELFHERPRGSWSESRRHAGPAVEQYHTGARPGSARAIAITMTAPTKATMMFPMRP